MRVRTLSAVVGFWLAIALPAPTPAHAAGGALFGIFPGTFVDDRSVPVVSLPSTYLGDLHDWQKRSNTIINMYDSVESPPNPALEEALIQAWWNDSVPMISFSTGFTPPGFVAEGALDEHLRAWGIKLMQFLAGPNAVYGDADDRRAYLRLNWEANGHWYPWSPCYDPLGQPQHHEPDSYVRMWQHIHKLFTGPILQGNLNINNGHLAWVWNISRHVEDGKNYCGDFRHVSQIYPGDEYVDWVGIDGYNHGEPQRGWESPSEVFGPAVAAVRSFTSKPLGIQEVASGTSPLGSKATWITNYFSYVQNNNIKMTVWFNHDKSSEGNPPAADGHDHAIFAGTGGNETFRGYNAYSQYREALQGSWLISTDPSHPRLLTNPQFLGQF